MMHIWKEIFIGMNEIKEWKKDNVNISGLDDWVECDVLNAVMMVG